MKFLIGLLLFLFSSCITKETSSFDIQEISPWCILGFDSLERTPEQRIDMLMQMGFKKYGYNRGKGNFDQMKKEFKLAQENDMQITSIFLWLNAKRDSIGKLSPSNQKLLDNLKELEQKPVIWVSFSDNFFKKLNDRESKSYAIKMLHFIKTKANEVGCELAIYNHHGWFGNPYHQVQIIKESNIDGLRMVYNFHHAHEYVDEFPEIAKKIKPYLSFVNLNGVKKEGPQILPIGDGDYEYQMIKTLQEQGYNGPWGILGHIKTEDVQIVLKRNLEGLKPLKKKHD